DLRRMLDWTLSQREHGLMMRAFLALSGLAFLRTSELVRLYDDEKVLHWEHILWSRKLVWVPANIAKETRRDDDVRFIPVCQTFEDLMWSYEGKMSGMVVPLKHHDFSVIWKKMHKDLGITAIKNGMRRSCISYTLSARPELGIVQAAKWAGNSEATVKKFY